MNVCYPRVNVPSPLENYQLSQKGTRISFMLKRDDLIHPHISGNKWRKLKGRILNIKNSNNILIVTTGGPHSNHLHAVAFATSGMKVRTVGLVSGKDPDFANPTLRDCANWGMQLLRISREQSSLFQRTPLELCRQLDLEADRIIPVPLGGDGPGSEYGLKEMVAEVEEETRGRPVEWVIPTGSGRTAEVVIDHASSARLVTLYAPFKSQRIRESLAARIGTPAAGPRVHWLSPPAVRFGRPDRTVTAQIMDFREQTGVLMDPIYNGPMLVKWLAERAGKSHLLPVLLHTGGLQGWRSFPHGDFVVNPK